MKLEYPFPGQATARCGGRPSPSLRQSRPMSVPTGPHLVAHKPCSRLRQSSDQVKCGGLCPAFPNRAGRARLNHGTTMNRRPAQ